jgi:ribosomal protein S18 acetylase RimI-like enzyme
MYHIALATKEDKGYLTQHFQIFREDVLLKKMAAGEILVVKEDDTYIGLLSWGYFWDRIPFMNMLWLEKAHRRRGVGTQVVEQWEQMMHFRGYRMVLTSTQADEDAQSFYRALGYQDIGSFTLPGDSAEIILHKRIVPKVKPGDTGPLHWPD